MCFIGQGSKGAIRDGVTCSDRLNTDSAASIRDLIIKRLAREIYCSVHCSHQYHVMLPAYKSALSSVREGWDDKLPP